MQIKTANNQEYINFIKGINKYDPEHRHISIPLATATECFEVAMASLDFNNSVEKANNYIFELGDLVWDLTALGIEGMWGLSPDLIFKCLETGFCLSQKRKREYLQYFQVHPLVKHGNAIVDNIHKLHYKNFYVEDKSVYRKALFDNTLEIAALLGVMIDDISHSLINMDTNNNAIIDINYILEMNMKKLTAQVGKVRGQDGQKN